MTTKYQFWSDEQKQQLVKFASMHQDNQKVKWSHYKNQVIGKTQQQCKSYYTNVLKHLQQPQVPKYNQNIVDIIYCFLELKGDAVKTRERFQHIDDKTYGTYLKHLDDIQVIIVAQIPYIMQYPNTSYKFDFEVLELYINILKRYPSCTEDLYKKNNAEADNNALLVNMEEALVLNSKIIQIMADRKFVMSLK
ncbi:SANT/Myb_domain [Hexamita inflata]|uniref:SANT/Myb_domain n=1 Tax=Hexamita inflata TaxID=28002 RepID=A0ABP1K2X7_9EUKA